MKSETSFKDFFRKQQRKNSLKNIVFPWESVFTAIAKILQGHRTTQTAHCAVQSVSLLEWAETGYRVVTPYTRQCFLWAVVTVIFGQFRSIFLLQKVHATCIAEAKEKNWGPKFILTPSNRVVLKAHVTFPESRGLFSKFRDRVCVSDWPTATGCFFYWSAQITCKSLQKSFKCHNFLRV